MPIHRWPSSAPGRSRIASDGGRVYTVAQASDLGASFMQQARESLEALDWHLQDAGSARSHLLSIQVLLADIADRAAFDAAWAAWIGPDPSHWPQLACHQAGLSPGLRIELVAVAATCPAPPSPTDGEEGGPTAGGYMEDRLDIPLRQVLAHMQHAIMNGTTYFGIPTLKGPIDAWTYQQILFDTRPDVIVELGNFKGGSALMLAHACDAIGGGRIIGVDLSHAPVAPPVRAHPRITLVEGDACASFGQVRRLVAGHERVMVIDDSAHTFDNTLQVLRLYSTLQKAGDYFIVEDSNCHHGLDIGPKPGPYEAIEAFLRENADFESDRSRERFLITWNPKGYLRRRAHGGGPDPALGS